MCHLCGQSCFSEGQGDSSVDGAGGAGSAPHLQGIYPLSSGFRRCLKAVLAGTGVSPDSGAHFLFYVPGPKNAARKRQSQSPKCTGLDGTRVHCIVHFLHVWHAQFALNKISALELSRKFIKGRLLVGFAQFVGK